MSDDKTVSEDTSPAVAKKAPAKKKSRKKASGSKPKPAAIRRARVYRFEQWAARRGVPQHHQGGLRAYVRDVHKPRTLEEWDECFKDY